MAVGAHTVVRVGGAVGMKPGCEASSCPVAVRMSPPDGSEKYLFSTTVHGGGISVTKEGAARLGEGLIRFFGLAESTDGSPDERPIVMPINYDGGDAEYLIISPEDGSTIRATGDDTRKLAEFFAGGGLEHLGTLATDVEHRLEPTREMVPA